MKIICPNCGFGRNVDEAKLPSKAVMATCPKCQHRFKFRELPKAPTGEAERPPHSHTAVEQPEMEQPQAPVQPDESVPTKAEAPRVETPPPHTTESHEEDLWRELEALNDDEEDVGEEHADDTQASLPEWERASSGYPQAFFRTFLHALSNPKGFFSAMPVGHGYMKPLLFFLVIIQAVALSQSLWQLLGHPAAEPADRRFGAHRPGRPGPHSLSHRSVCLPLPGHGHKPLFPAPVQSGHQGLRRQHSVRRPTVRHQCCSWSFPTSACPWP